MTFLNSEDAKIFAESIRKFSDLEILPNLKNWEESKHYPSSLFSTLGHQGYLGILVEECWGGSNYSYQMAATWIWEFGKVPSLGLTTGINMHSLVVLPALQKFGSPGAKAKWLKLGVSGEKIGAYAFTEPGAGSDLTRIVTRATKTKSGWELSGSKIFITNGQRADFVLVLAKTDPNAGYDGFTTFLVDTKAQGFSVSRTLDKLGWHCSDTAELVFDKVQLDSDAVLGQVGGGWHQAMASLEWERLMLSLQALSGAHSCLNSTQLYAKDRELFGTKLGELPISSYRFNDFASRLHAAEALATKCLTFLESDQRCRKEVSLLKILACELAIEVADRCLQMHGGYGYTTEFIPERWLRDLRLLTIGGGASEVLSKVAAREITRL